MVRNQEMQVVIFNGMPAIILLFYLIYLIILISGIVKFQTREKKKNNSMTVFKISNMFCRYKYKICKKIVLSKIPHIYKNQS